MVKLQRFALLQVNWLISHPALQSNKDTPTLCLALTPLTHPVSTSSIHNPADSALLQLLTDAAVQQTGSPAFKAAANTLFLRYSVPWAAASKLDITSTCFSSHLISTRAAHSASCNFVPPQVAVSAVGLKQLLRDCQLVPQHLTLQQAWTAADVSRPAAWRTGTPAHPDPLTYSAFVEWLGRIALIAFHAQSASRQQKWQQAAGGQQDSKPRQGEVPEPTGPATAFQAHWPAGSTAARTCSTAPRADLAGGECEAVHPSYGAATSLSSRPPFQYRTRGGWGLSNQKLQEEEEARQHQEVLAAAKEAAAGDTAKLQQQVSRRWKLLQQHERAKSARQALQQAAGQAVVDGLNDQQC
eukprot:gene10350-10508_t